MTLSELKEKQSKLVADLDQAKYVMDRAKEVYEAIKSEITDVLAAEELDGLDLAGTDCSYKVSRVVRKRQEVNIQALVKNDLATFSCLVPFFSVKVSDVKKNQDLYAKCKKYVTETESVSWLLKRGE